MASMLNSDTAAFGAAWDDCGGAGMHFELTVHNSLRAKFNGAGAVSRASASAVGRSAFDMHHGYSS